MSSVDRERYSGLGAGLACVLLGAVAVWLLARLVWLLLAGAPPPIATSSATPAGSAAAPAPSIAKWHLFGTLDRMRPDGRLAPATTLALTLRGTLADADPQSGVAVIGDGEGGERAWRAGSEIAPGVRLKAVYPEHVVLLHDGAEETLRLPRETRLAPAAPVPVTPTTVRSGGGRPAFPADPAAAAPAAAFTPPQMAHGAVDWQQAMDQLKGGADLARHLQPVRQDGKIVGMQLTGVDPALLARYGLQAGDVVTAVNGVTVGSSMPSPQLLASLQGGGAVRARILRNGQPIELTLNTQ